MLIRIKKTFFVRFLMKVIGLALMIFISINGVNDLILQNHSKWYQWCLLSFSQPIFILGLITFLTPIIFTDSSICKLLFNNMFFLIFSRLSFGMYLA